MAVDPSKLRKLGRRGLGTPPTDGSPGIEEDTTLPSGAERGTAIGVLAAPVPSSSPPEPNGMEGMADASEPADEKEPEIPAPVRRASVPVGRGRGVEATA